MSDVYAKAGIPMPPNPNEDAEPYIKPMTTEAKLENTQNPDAIDWAKRAEEERDRDIRLECLKLVSGSVRQDKVVREAEKLFVYVKEGTVDPITAFNIACGTCLYYETLESREQAEEHLEEHFKRQHPAMHKHLYG